MTGMTPFPEIFLAEQFLLLEFCLRSAGLQSRLCLLLRPTISILPRDKHRL
jgi:hypothetical protein